MRDNKKRMENLPERLKTALSSVIRGKEGVVHQAVVCLLAGGHLLIEDVPGVGKTTLAATLARATGGGFRRIQFTSDLLPSDILGTQVFNRKTGEFQFHHGPIFSNIVLADEINRTNPKTQSALLEAMNEHRVSLDGQTFELPAPFMLIATQNPVEHHGTFPLPESQLDRFMMSIRIGYPEFDVEREVVEAGLSAGNTDGAESVISADALKRLRQRVGEVKSDRAITDYLLRIVRATRANEKIRLGASTRGAMFLLQAARATAVMAERDYLVPDDVKSMSEAVLSHRLILKNGADRETARVLLRSILAEIEVPL